MQEETLCSHLGISCYGSAVIRVNPDIARVELTVDSLKDEAKDAFIAVQKKTAAVMALLKTMNIHESQSSRVSLERETRWVDGEHTVLGYNAALGLNILVRDVSLVEKMILGCIEAGANKIRSVHFDTIKLRETRATARKNAIRSARAKAMDYCEEAGVRLGKVVKIDDLNPARVSGNRESYQEYEFEEDPDAGVRAIDPGAVNVTAAVQVLFELN